MPDPTRFTLIRLAGTCALAAATWPVVLNAQSLDDIEVPEEPLTLSDRGSFFVGGETVEQTEVELGSFGPDDQVTVNQMYVEYIVPEAGGEVPVVMIHGATLTGKTYDTTPDGRMGWYEYFVRQDHPVYVVDQVGRGRSGFNQATYNNVQACETPPEEQAPMLRLGDRIAVWQNFRFGPEPGTPYENTKFPVEFADELSKQSIPDLNSGLPSPNPTFAALADLSAQLDGAVLIGHSQSGHFPLEAALIDPQGIRGAVLVEPGRCDAQGYSEEQIAALAEIPTLVMFGDHLPADTGLPAPNWQERFEGCRDFVERVNAAGGEAQILNPPDRGIAGNTHMMMQDVNNLEIADLILDWIDETVATQPE